MRVKQNVHLAMTAGRSLKETRVLIRWKVFVRQVIQISTKYTEATVISSKYLPIFFSRGSNCYNQLIPHLP